MMQRLYVITATGKITANEVVRHSKEARICVNAADDAPGLTFGAAGAPSLTPRVNRIDLNEWILAVSLDKHKKSGGIGGASDGGQRSCSFSLSIQTCARDSDVQPLEACGAANCIWCSDLACRPEDDRVREW